jgi:hypothetical protein
VSETSRLRCQLASVVPLLRKAGVAAKVSSDSSAFARRLSSLSEDRLAPILGERPFAFLFWHRRYCRVFATIAWWDQDSAAQAARIWQQYEALVIRKA